MTRIECTKCGEIVDTTTRVITAPFVCRECLLADDLLGAMTPTLASPVTTQGMYATSQQEPESVEATNLLIADLKEKIEMLEESYSALQDIAIRRGERLTSGGSRTRSIDGEVL